MRKNTTKSCVEDERNLSEDDISNTANILPVRTGL